MAKARIFNEDGSVKTIDYKTKKVIIEFELRKGFPPIKWCEDL